jgi:DNA-binding CsgD family transcriptional regulator
MLGRRLVQSPDEDIAETVHHEDECPTNNRPENLRVMTRRAHRKLHAQKQAEAKKELLTYDMVSEALDGRTQKEAAEILQVHPHTLHNRFPEILAPRKRKAPVLIDDPYCIDLIRSLAGNPKWSLKEIAKEAGVSPVSVKRICDRHQIPYTRKSREGEVHRTYNLKKPKLVDTPECVEIVRSLATDPDWSLKEIAKKAGISPLSVRKICDHHKIPYTPKARQVGVYKDRPRRRNRRKNSTLSVLELHESENEPGKQ